MAPQPTPSADTWTVLKAGLWGGFVAGTLDVMLALTLYGQGPMRTFQGVASGLLGKTAYDGGWPTSLVGYACHFFIAITWSLVFALVSLKLPVLVRLAVAAGLAYGVLIFFTMNYVVIPLSAAPFGRPFQLSVLQNPTWLKGLAGHMVLIGLPMALFARSGHKRHAGA
jgi:uncharacterized membrane protein YagU involved in acid resistance